MRVLNFFYLLELGVSFVVLNYIYLSFMQIYAVFYFNYIIYSGLQMFCCQNDATSFTTLNETSKKYQLSIKAVFLLISSLRNNLYSFKFSSCGFIKAAYDINPII